MVKPPRRIIIRRMMPLKTMRIGRPREKSWEMRVGEPAPSAMGNFSCARLSSLNLIGSALTFGANKKRDRVRKVIIFFIVQVFLARLHQ